MFIAVINENFDVAEEAKKGKQASNYWAEASRPTAGHITWLRRLNPYRWIRASPVEVKVEALPANLVLPMQKSLVTDYSVPKAHSILEVCLHWLGRENCAGFLSCVGRDRHDGHGTHGQDSFLDKESHGAAEAVCGGDEERHSAGNTEAHTG
jgi:hypothetical protein